MADLVTSPIAPGAGSRTWSAGTSGVVAVAVLVVLAGLNPSLALPLLIGALIAGLAGWAAARPSAVVAVVSPEPAALAADPQARRALAVFEALSDPVMVVSGGEADDIAGRRVVMANPAAREALKIQGDGALLVTLLRDPAALEAIDEALFGGLTRFADYEAAGAQDRIWRVWTRPLGDGSEGPLALVALRDETDVRRMERMRVDFLANASHELKTPLASLSGFIETLRGHARDDERARERFLDIMAAQAERMSRLVADLLSLSRIELNEHIPPSGRVDVARAAADVVDALSVLSEEKGVTLSLEEAAPDESLLDGAEPVRAAGGRAASVTGDRDEIVQVVQNLVDNAIKYSRPGDTVRILIRRDLTWETGVPAAAPELNRLSLLTPDREGGAVYAGVTVIDRGPGMAREQLPRLTERFYRVEGQKSGERLGTGLGLAIVKHIVNRHRGGLMVESAPDRGAAFTAYFPVAAPRQAAPPTL